MHAPPFHVARWDAWREARTRDLATTSKAWLRRRLHAAIVREYLEGSMVDEQA